MTSSRDQAWKTRRLRYGPRGHSGSYARHMYEDRAVELARTEIRLCRLVALCIGTGLLSEGQIGRALDCNRIEVRRLRDDGRESIANSPIPGHWGAHASKEAAS